MINMQNGTFTLQLNHIYKASKDRVFQAWTNQELLRHWWGPEGYTTTVDKMDVVKGGDYRFIMRAPNGDNRIIGGKYVEIVPNEKLVFTWKWEQDPEETLVTIEFREHGIGTELFVTHENFSSKEQAENHSKGWGSSLESGLMKYLEQSV